MTFALKYVFLQPQNVYTLVLMNNFYGSLQYRFYTTCVTDMITALAELEMLPAGINLSQMSKAKALEELYHQWPDLFLLDRDISRFSMINRVGDMSFTTKVVVPNFPNPRGSTVEVDPCYSHLLNQEQVQELSSKSKDMTELLQGIELLLQKNQTHLEAPLLGAGEVKHSANVMAVLDEVPILMLASPY